MKLKNLVFSAAVIAAISGCGGGSGAAPASSPPPTSNRVTLPAPQLAAGWTTVADTAEGFSLSLPAGWQHARVSSSYQAADLAAVKPQNLAQVWKQKLDQNADAHFVLFGADIPSQAQTGILTNLTVNQDAPSTNTVKAGTARQVLDHTAKAYEDGLAANKGYHPVSNKVVKLAVGDAYEYEATVDAAKPIRTISFVFIDRHAGQDQAYYLTFSSAPSYSPDVFMQIADTLRLG